MARQTEKFDPFMARFSKKQVAQRKRILKKLRAANPTTSEAEVVRIAWDFYAAAHDKN